MRSRKVKVFMKNIFKRVLVFLFCIALFSLFMRFTSVEDYFHYEYKLRKRKTNPPFLLSQDKWIDSVFNSLTPSEKIAQLIMIPAYQNDNGFNEKEVSKLIEKYNIGGLIFFQGNPYKLASLTNKYQSLAKTPLIISIDAECGLAMRLDSTIRYPDQIILGAINNEKLLYEMGAHIARQLKHLGIHINMAPVIDVNNNPDNPIINYRSFGEDRVNVARKGILYMKGLQDNNILAVAKHFPGHGDTNDDSHYTLPLIPHSRQRIDSIELFPFKELINSGVGGVMVAHLSIPALDDSPKLASSLSKVIVNDLLKNEMGFKGLVITDAMNMGGITKHFKPREANVKAISAGNDILLMPCNVPKAISSIQREIRKGNISQAEIDKRCRKVLAAKYWAGLSNYKPVDLSNLNVKLNAPEYKLLYRKLVEASLTLSRNKNNIIPLKRLDTLSIVSVALGSEIPNTFQNTLELYTKIDKICLGKDATSSQIKNELDNYDLIIISTHNTNRRISDNYGISGKMIEFIDSASENYNVILNISANPYSLSGFKNLGRLSGLIVSYEDTDITQSLSAQLIFGAIPADGSLPVSASKELPAGTGIKTKGNIRLKYTVPEEADLDENKLAKIDSVALGAIQEKATPGCQILVAREGKVVYYKSFGYHTYSKKRKVENSDLYDLASITKIASTMPLIMRLYEQNKLDIN
jgi:beta-N-acetylhexosaminidase